MSGVAEEVLNNIILICFGKAEVLVTNKIWSRDLFLLYLLLSFLDTFFINKIRNEVISSDDFWYPLFYKSSSH